MDIFRKVNAFLSKHSNGNETPQQRREMMKNFKDDLYNGIEVQSSFFCTQPQDTRDLILDLLNLEELVNLGLTSKYLHSAVIAFIKHECNSNGLQHSLDRFSKNNSDLLTPLEKNITSVAAANKIDMTKTVEELTSSDRRHLWWLEREKNIFRNQTIRISVTDDSVHFPHKNTHHIPVQEDAALGRMVCSVDNVCWLHVVTTFKDIEPGTYVCSLVLKVKSNCRMPHSQNQATSWIVSHKDEKDQGVSVTQTQRTGREFWDQLSEQRTPVPELCDGLTVEVVDVADARENWIAIRLPEFRLSLMGDVVFEMKDIECGWWKSGLVIDFIQIKKQHQ